MLEIRTIGPANLPDAARLCLAGKTPGDRPRAFTREIELECTRCKLSELYEKIAAGARAFAAYRAGMLVGYLESHPVRTAPAPVDGAGYVITCLRVPEVGEREEVEGALLDHTANAVQSSGGLAVIAREKRWDDLGFEQVECDSSEVIGYERVLWWRNLGGAAPCLVPVDRDLPRIQDRIRVDLFVSDRCPWDRYVFDMIRGVCERIGDSVMLFETDCSARREVVRCGVVSAVAVNGEYKAWLRPHVLPDEHEIRRTLENII